MRCTERLFNFLYGGFFIWIRKYRTATKLIKNYRKFQTNAENNQLIFTNIAGKFY